MLISQPLAATPSQLAKPPLQVPSPQTIAVHVADAFAKPHAVAQVPQFEGSLRRSVSQPFAASPSQFAKFVAHVKPQLLPSQVDVALAGATQGVQLAPHVATAEFATQAPPQAWKPALQVIPHAVPSQLAMPFIGTVHALHEEAPQVAVLALDTHAPAHAWNPGLHVNPQLVPSQVEVAFAGGTQGEHDAAQVPVLVLLTQTPPHE